LDLFDLHCDTLTELRNSSQTLLNSTQAVSLSGMKCFDKCKRAFAIFVPDTLKGKEAEDYFDTLYSVFVQNKEIILKQSESSIEMLLTVENGNMLSGRLENIEKLKSRNVKALTLTWNGENELGFGQLKNRGLKAFGKECIPVLEQNDIVVDVSHLSDKGFEDVCAVAKRPFIATHSNARKICNHKRNLTDEQIVEIIARKGLIGLNFYHTFLNDNPAVASSSDILRHAEHILSLGGENALCIGTDFDGAEIIRELDYDSKLTMLEKLFIDNGFSKELAQKITYSNANNFFKYHKDV